MLNYYIVQVSQHRVDVRVQEPMLETVVVHDLVGAAVGPLLGALMDGAAVGLLLGATVDGVAVGPSLGATVDGSAVGP